MMKTKNVTTKNQKWSFEFNFFLSIRHKFVYISIEIMKSSQFFLLHWIKIGWNLNALFFTEILYHLPAIALFNELSNQIYSFWSTQKYRLFVATP